MAVTSDDIGARHPAHLLRSWHDARALGLNNRAAARKLGVSERELIASACGDFVTRLRPESSLLLAALTGAIVAVRKQPKLAITDRVVDQAWAIGLPKLAERGFIPPDAHFLAGM